MREIKFRKWDFEEKEMISGDALAFEEYAPLVHLLNQEGIMQYTGLKDRNGKEIYDGDIIKQIFHVEVRDEQGEWVALDGHHIGEIVITATKGVCIRNPFCYSEETDETTRSNQYKSVSGYRSEVIGNRYTNPEILKEDITKWTNTTNTP